MLSDLSPPSHADGIRGWLLFPRLNELPVFQKTLILMDGLRLQHLPGVAVQKPVRQAADMRCETSTRFRPASMRLLLLLLLLNDFCTIPLPHWCKPENKKHVRGNAFVAWIGRRAGLSQKGWTCTGTTDTARINSLCAILMSYLCLLVWKFLTGDLTQLLRN